MENNEEICLIDADILLYKVAFSCESYPDFYIVKEMIYKELCTVLAMNNTTKYIGFLTGRNNFRKIFYPEYKANRKDKVKPKWFKKLKEYMVDDMKFFSVDTLEADDLISIYSKYNKNSIICSTDKDLLQIEGFHYNLTKQTRSVVSYEEANLNLWRQVLMGDSADNIKGLEGIGTVRASKLLQDSNNYLFKTISEYIHVYGQYKGIEQFTTNYKLIKLLESSDLFDPETVTVSELNYKIPVENYIGKMKMINGEEGI